MARRMDPRRDGAKVEVLNDLVIEVVEARSLRAADSGGMFSSASSDPYVIIKDVKGLRGSDKRTRIVKKSLNPKWNQSFKYQFNYKLSELKFLVMDSDRDDFVNMDGDDLLGKAKIGMDACYGKAPVGSTGTVDVWLPLKKGSGQLHVRLHVTFRIPVVVPGVRVPLGPQFQVAVGWDFKKKERPIDLDASIIGFDRDERVVDTVSYRNLTGFGGAVRHSGDDTTGEGDGDDETIAVDCSRMPKNTEKLAVVINSFTGQPLSKTKYAYIRIIQYGVTQCFFGLGKGKVPNCTGLFVGSVQLSPTGEFFEFLTCGAAVRGTTANGSTHDIVAFGNQNLGWKDDYRAGAAMSHPHMRTAAPAQPHANLSPASSHFAAAAVAVAAPPRTTAGNAAYFHIDPSNNQRIPFSDQDNATIFAAQSRGAPSVPISPVTLGNGTVLQFEVRFGQNAKSRKMPRGSRTGICQVNLGNENTRVVEREDRQGASLGAVPTAAAARPSTAVASAAASLGAVPTAAAARPFTAVASATPPSSGASPPGFGVSAPGPPGFGPPGFVGSAPPPDEWYYIDPSGTKQGPFKKTQLLGWKASLPPDLMVIAPVPPGSPPSQPAPMHSIALLADASTPTVAPTPAISSQQQPKELQVTCPQNVQPGSTIYVRSPSGAPLAVMIPAGVHPGMAFVVQCS